MSLDGEKVHTPACDRVPMELGTFEMYDNKHAIAGASRQNALAFFHCYFLICLCPA